MEFQDIRLSVSESAKIFGVSQKSIRRALNDELLQYIVVRGRYRISFKSLLSWSQTSQRRKNALSKHGIGQFVNQWNISNKRYSPHPKNVEQFIQSKNQA